MSTALANTQTSELSAMTESELIGVLKSSLYPGASDGAIKMVMDYCRAAGLDPMQKPVHIVPMWDKNTKQMRDVVMPGIGLYRTQAARSGQYAGVTDPEFGPTVTETIGGTSITFPTWCRVTVKRLLGPHVVDFSACEFWKENYATAGKDSAAPNAMWKKRPYGQIAKCAEAQALRKAFPELGAAPTADEMEGKGFIECEVNPMQNNQQRQTGAQAAEAARAKLAASFDPAERQNLVTDLEVVAKEQGTAAYAECWMALTGAQRKMVGAEEHARLKRIAESMGSTANTVDHETGEITEGDSNE